MKSFSESLQITKNMNLAKHCFLMMAEQGVNPISFVDWYTEEGVSYQQNGVLQESANIWLKEAELPQTSHSLGTWAGKARKVFGQGLNWARTAANHMQNDYHKGMGYSDWHQQVDVAEKALNILHRRMGVSPDLLQDVGGQQFMQTVLGLIQTLRSKNWEEIGNSRKINSNSSIPEDEPQSFDTHNESYVNDLKIKNEIRSNLRKIQSFGIDPVEFVEQYSKQILSEGMWDRAGEAFGNFGANVAGSMGRWMTGSQRQSWGFDAKNRITRKNSESITSAMNALGQLEKQIGNVNPEFKKTLDAVIDGLEKARQKTQERQSQAAPQQSQATQPTPQQAQVTQQQFAG